MSAVASRLFCTLCNETTVHTGSGCCFHPVARQLKPQPKAPRQKPPHRSPGRTPRDLTAQEVQILDYLVQGLGRRQIAELLGIHVNCVHAAVSVARRRMHVHSSGALVELMRERAQGVGV